MSIRAQFRPRLPSLSTTGALFRRISTLFYHNFTILRRRIMTLFSSVWRGDPCRIRAIPRGARIRQKSPCEKASVFAFRYRKNGETACRTLPVERDHVHYRTFYVGGVCSPFVSDMRRHGFSDGETIPGGGMFMVRGDVAGTY